MAIIEWVVWALACVVLLSFLLAALVQRDSGLRSHHTRHCMFLIAGLVITVITDVSKLHLLWWVPVTFFLNIVLSNMFLALRIKRGLRDLENQRRDKFEEKEKKRVQS